jgi:SAM-dependent methyltransferase
MRANRRLDWVSSVDGNPEVLTELDRAMTEFYGRPKRRELYQRMLSAQEDSPLAPGSPGDRLLAAVFESGAHTVVEVGCGNGWLYRHLRCRGFAGQYTGLEMAEDVTATNAARHSDARWLVGSVYRMPLDDGAVDVAFAFYVLEHTVYPERALNEMLRVVRPGGVCLLVFPDFSTLGYLPSQQTGITPGAARDKYRRGWLFDAAVTLYDSRVRVRRALRRRRDLFGPFPVNTRPICLSYPESMWADIDAVYITDKDEVRAWAGEQGHRVDFPAGREGQFAHHAYLAIRRRGE